MRNFLKSKKIFNSIIAIILVYTAIVFIGQEKKLNEYSSQMKYYESQKISLEKEQKELMQEQENINSPEYIEEKLDMYYPNERVYIVQ